jgi:hypothetical protein
LYSSKPALASFFPHFVETIASSDYQLTWAIWLQHPWGLIAFRWASLLRVLRMC